MEDAFFIMTPFITRALYAERRFVSIVGRGRELF
jgi:hypothetical protein